MASIELHGIGKNFGPNRILDSIDLRIADGEFVTLIGPSGCGKSTLLRIISGLETNTEGSIFIDGKRVDLLSPRERDIAMVFQSYALYPHMTVAENIGFNLKIAREPRSDIDSRVREAARMLDLLHLLQRRPAQLSGGQRQRVAMGRAIVRNPCAFLFDEPLSNLDAKLRVQMRAELKLLHQRLATTSIYVTHDQIEAMTLADRIVVLNMGRVEQQGNPIELYAKPANLFVAGFIGSPQMNFLEGTMTSVDGRAMIRLAGGALLEFQSRATLDDGRPVTIGARPEHFLTTADGAPTLSGKIALVELTGSQAFVRFMFGDTFVTAVLPGDTALRTGETFESVFDKRNIHVFDRHSGARLN